MRGRPLRKRCSHISPASTALPGAPSISRTRYLSWADKSGPTGREKIVYGLYTLYDPADCNRGISSANETEPHDAALEEAGTAFMSSLMALTPLVKEAADYYEQGDYKDDKIAKGRQLHPRLMAAWDGFLAANGRLRDAVERINEQVQLEALARIEKTEGRKTRYFALALMIKAKALVRAEGDGDAGAFDLARVTQALEGYEAAIKDIEAHGAGNPEEKAGSIFVSGRPVVPQDRKGADAARARQDAVQRGREDEPQQFAVRLDGGGVAARPHP